MTTRRGRGPVQLDHAQQAKLSVVRQRRIDRDNGLEELEIQIQKLRDTYMFERDAALRLAVHQAKDARVPNAHIKRVLNITDDRTFKRWLEGYVAPADPFADALPGTWFILQPAVDGWYPVLLAYDPSTPLYVRPGESLDAPTWREDSLLVIQENPELPKWVEDQDKNQGELLRAIYEKKANDEGVTE